MDDLFRVLLVLHIVGGGAGLIAGTVNALRPKGDQLHRFAGRVFLYGMLVAAGCSLLLSVLHPNYFLFIIGVFTLYMTGTGTRYLSLRGLASGQKPAVIDWVLTGGMTVFSAVFIGIGIYHIMRGYSFGVVFVAFGYVSSRMVRADLRAYSGRSPIANVWLTTHLQRMMGAYIAAITAFVVVNLPHDLLPGSWAFVAWLLPSAILVPLILYWTRRYEVKKKTDEA